ncbi:unnamed protein product [Cylindrotheca closterium]|uniref:PHD-type domain-containing protein n=1 Tax=Cylindrotheca closterium TaxID=2856 RepID=A0AAD2FQJ7_9STRA|nr:unnamed protein product [Cylindrotheca closterium]
MVKRKKQEIKKEEDAEELIPSNDDEDTEDEESPASSSPHAKGASKKKGRIQRKTRSPRRASRRAMAKLKEEDTEDEEDVKDEHASNIDADETEDDEAYSNQDGKGDGKRDDDDEEEGDVAQPKKKRKTGKGKHKCPHCEKEFSSEGGLKYHIDQCTDPKILAKANKKKRTRGKTKTRGTDTPKSYSKRFRGKLEDRRCPDCDRVFTSTLGLNYHISRKVCQQNNKSDSKQMILNNLAPGERFMTTFGVVQVVSDGRGESTAPVCKIPPTELRTYNSKKIKTEKQRHKCMVSKYIRLRARKRQINMLLEEGKSINKTSVFFAYHGGNPTDLNENKKLAPMPLLPDDIHVPPEACPDRMVECVWVQLDGSIPENQNSTQRLFLQRRILTDPYVGSGNINACEDCGRKFTSTPGYTYHVRNRVCISKNAKLSAARKETQHTLEAGASRILANKCFPPEYEPQQDFAPRKRKGKRKKVFGMYPEVVISLGYKVIKEDIKFTDDMLFHASTEMEMMGSNAPPPTLSLTKDAPEKIMEDLAKKLEERQRVSDDQKYGSMYKEVYKALRYTKPKNRKDIGSSLRRKRAKVVKPTPPIIDISALADEIDSGRYPSKKRYKGDDHTDYCAICKDVGSLLCCDFCRNAVHMHCMADKFTIKAPEPDEDFMCHKCIQTIMARRKRAEGRRLKKQEKDEADRITIQRQNPDIKAGMEYEQLASKGQEYSELIELLQDARQRLRQSLATSKMNDIRRKLMQFD